MKYIVIILILCYMFPNPYILNIYPKVKRQAFWKCNTILQQLQNSIDQPYQWRGSEAQMSLSTGLREMSVSDDDQATIHGKGGAFPGILDSVAHKSL